MNLNILQLNLRKLVIYLIMALMIMFLAVVLPEIKLVTFAEGEVEPLPQELIDYKTQLAGSIPAANLAECKTALVPVYDIETLEFLKFLETNFHSKSSNSSLVNIAIARYAEYKRTMRGYLASLEPKATSQSGSVDQQTSQFELYSKCVELTDIYIELTKDKMIEHIKANSAQKKTTMFYEKYKGISDRLNDMNFAIAQMFALFESFNNRFEKFVPTCTQ